jgi:hypothetical protein
MWASPYTTVAVRGRWGWLMNQESGTIRAIETVYNGYRFRSRLEARWAVFFDTLGVRYEYEPQGFELARPGRRAVLYLPDFWIPDLGFWVEIKPTPPDAAASAKCAFLASQTKCDVFCFDHPEFSAPTFDVQAGRFSGAWARGWRAGDRWEAGQEWGHFGSCWMECQQCMVGGVPGFVGVLNALGMEMHWRETGHHPASMRKNTERLLAAYVAARQARFEHGETPVVGARTIVFDTPQVGHMEPSLPFREGLVFKAGEIVSHSIFGTGVVLNAKALHGGDSDVTVRFEDGQVRTLSAQLARLEVRA